MLDSDKIYVALELDKLHFGERLKHKVCELQCFLLILLNLDVLRPGVLVIEKWS